MERTRTMDRKRAVERYELRESAEAIAASMGYSPRWVYKWVERASSGEDEWWLDRSRRPGQTRRRYDGSIQSLIVKVRDELENEGNFSGAQSIEWELEQRGLDAIPSVRTIGRVLKSHGRIHRRQGRYKSKGKIYPGPVIEGPGSVHQSDFVGPRYLKGPVRFYSLNHVDLTSARCATTPMQARAGQATIDAFWSCWKRLGMPAAQQIDNEAIFYGSRRHPRAMGQLIRLCLLHGIEPWFIPPAEPWRNSVVEKFNDYFGRKFLNRIVMESFEQLHVESLAFEQRHNSRWRYSKLGGKTPNQFLSNSRRTLRFPTSDQPPEHPLPKPETGRYHLVRFIRSDGLLDVFGERFPVPPEAIYEYVRATVDVDQQKLLFYLDGHLIDQFSYRLR